MQERRTFGGPLISMEDAADLHCHPYPDLFPRLADDVGVATAARDAGMRAVVLKCHIESTVSRAYHTQRQVPGIRVFGGLVLNSYVGFINPAAVEAALRLGAVEIWMPTIDAGHHEQVYGSTGSYDIQQGALVGPSVWIEDEQGNLKPEVYQVLELVAKHRAILGTCHLSPREIVKLVREARRLGVEKINVTHPFFKVPGLDLPTLEELVRLGATPEFGYCTVSPAWHSATVEKLVDAIRRIGAARCLLVSDAGQRHNPLPSEALRVFGQTLFEKGLSEDDIRTMIVSNPLERLNLSASGAVPASTETAPVPA